MMGGCLGCRFSGVSIICVSVFMVAVCVMLRWWVGCGGLLGFECCLIVRCGGLLGFGNLVWGWYNIRSGFV